MVSFLLMKDMENVINHVISVTPFLFMRYMKDVITHLISIAPVRSPLSKEYRNLRPPAK